MAVKYDTPWGPIEADNAASEATLQAILVALDKDSTKNKKAQKADEDAAKASGERTKADKDATKAGKDFSVGWAAAGNAAIKGLKDIGLTAVSMATKFGTDFVNIAENPIKETAGMLNSLIDVGAGVVSSFAEAIPIIGGFIAAASKAAAELAKAANKAFAEQLQRNIDTLQAYNKVGVSFVGGMNQMNRVAHGAGLGLSDFSKIVSQNKDVLNRLGLAGGEAATKLGGAMGIAAKQTNKAGLTLRDEMFKMGYSYEEQGAVFTSFMANMQTAGKLRAMSDQQIAEGTRKYATDLKVIADLTGQDAKKLAERSRAEALRGSLLAELSGDQVTAFQRANEMLSKAGPEVQAALTQYIKFGTITDPKVIANRELSTMIKNVGTEVKKGNTDMVNVTNREMANASKEMLSGQGKAFGSAVDSALVAGVGGMGADIADVRNKFMAATYGLDPDAAKKSAEASENQANNADKVADETAKLYAQTKNFQVLMETKVNTELGRYAELLKEVNDLTMGNFAKFIKGEGGMSAADKGKVAEGRKASATGLLGMSDDAALRHIKQQEWLKSQGITRNPGGVFFGPGGENLGILFDKLPGAPKFDKGGSLGSGGLGIAGENGPELIGGPASILSTVDTKNLSLVIDSIKGFENFNYDQLQNTAQRKQELMSSSGPDQFGDTNKITGQLESALNEMIRLMRQNLDQTTRVAMNTN